MALLSAETRADEIVLGGSDSSLGTVSISCPGGMGACSLSIVSGTGQLGSSSATTGFEAPTGTQVTVGSYAFTGGPSTLQSSNGGITFNMGGTPWGFTFTDGAGDSLTANTDWNTFFSSAPAGFQVGQLDFSTLSITCGAGQIGTQFCTDFTGGGAIDVTLQGLSQDVGSLWASAQGGTEANIGVEGGSIIPAPEPGTLVLFGTGLLGLAGFIRRRISHI